MDSNTSSPTSTYWMIWPSEALSEELPREMLLPNRVARVKVIVTPTITAITTPARKYAESLSALGAVTKMIADMICGPASIVKARGRTSSFIGSPSSVRPPPPADYTSRPEDGAASSPVSYRIVGYGEPPRRATRDHAWLQRSFQGGIILASARAREKRSQGGMEYHVLFFVAAVAAGLINSLAGGGGLITFPLLALVVPPVVADAARAPLPSFPPTPAPCGVPAASCARYAGCGSGCSSSPALWAGWWERCCWSGRASGTCCSSYRGWCSAARSCSCWSREFPALAWALTKTAALLRRCGRSRRLWCS